MIKHTPGPWKVIKMQESNSLHIISTNKPGWNEFPLADLIYPIDKETKANAHLISAAPELLEACKKLRKDIGADVKVRHIETDCNCGCCLTKRAIAKAEGGKRE